MSDAPLYVGLVASFASVTDKIADFVEDALDEKVHRTTFTNSMGEPGAGLGKDSITGSKILPSTAPGNAPKVLLVTDVCSEAQLAYLKSQANSLLVFIDSTKYQGAAQSDFVTRYTTLAAHDCDLVLVNNEGSAKSTAGALCEMIRQRL